MPSTEETSTDQRLAEDTIYIYQRMQTQMLIAAVGLVTPISVLQDRRIPSWQALKSLQWQITRCLDFISKTNRRERSVEVKIRSLLHLCTHEVYVIGHSLHHFKEEFKPQFARNILSVFHLPINAAHSSNELCYLGSFYCSQFPYCSAIVLPTQAEGRHALRTFLSLLYLQLYNFTRYLYKIYMNNFLAPQVAKANLSGQGWQKERITFTAK